MDKPKYEVRLTVDEIALLKECLQERNNRLQRNLQDTITAKVVIENDKKHSFDDDFKKWTDDRLTKQYEEQAVIAHIETLLKNAKEESVSLVHCDYDLCYMDKNPQVVDGWNTKSVVAYRDIPLDLNGMEFSNGEIAVRFEANLDRTGYDILIKRR